MYTDIVNTTHPKVTFKFSPRINFVRYEPANTPAIANPDKPSRNGKSISRTNDTFPTKPISELTVIMINEVPTAFFMGSPAVYIKAGTIRKPPPAPTKPVINPTPMAMKMNFQLVLRVEVFRLLSPLCLIIFIEAINMMMENKIMMAISLVIATKNSVPIFSGMAGRSVWRVMKTATVEGSEKSHALLKSIVSFDTFLKLPTRAVTPTINKE